jgi:glutamate N-acetyltransferase/amino-acid N-acetyltransferase
MYSLTERGVCAPDGFKAAGINCGIRNNKVKKDLAIIISDVDASAAAVYTLNTVRGVPVELTRTHLRDGKARAILCNSGNANTCNADGPQIAKSMCRLAGEHFGINPEDIIIASTGVIGKPLSLEPIQRGIPLLKAAISGQGSLDAAMAIMTTDTRVKQVSACCQIGGKMCSFGGMAKGSGMIHPNMATMLVFLTTDTAISPEMLQKAISQDVQHTFNMVSIDGDTSTNDMCAILANGLAGNQPIIDQNEDYALFCEALRGVTETLCRMIAKDGEGATKLLSVHVSDAPDEVAAKRVARSVVSSSLVKSAMFGADANWGRILCAAGYADASVDLSLVSVRFVSDVGSVSVCERGTGVPFNEDQARSVLSADEITVLICLHNGHHAATSWGCDLSYEYVRINGDYRS